MERCPSWPKEHDWKSCRRLKPSRGFESLSLRHIGPLVKRLRHRPFTAVTGVRIPYGSPLKYGRLAQLGEHLPYKQRVGGSNPSSSTIRYIAGWSSPVARRAHNPKVVGSNPTPATNYILAMASI